MDCTYFDTKLIEKKWLKIVHFYLLWIYCQSSIDFVVFFLKYESIKFIWFKENIHFHYFMTLTTGKHIFLKNTLFVTWTPDEKLNSDCTAVRYKKYEGKNCSELKKNGRAHEYRSWKNEYDVLYFLTWLWTDPYTWP